MQTWNVGVDSAKAISRQRNLEVLTTGNEEHAWMVVLTHPSWSLPSVHRNPNSTLYLVHRGRYSVPFENK